MQNPFKNNKILKVSIAEVEGWRQEIRMHVKAREQLALQISDLTNEVWAGNAYRAYEAAVTAIDAKYNNKSKWGTELTGCIIDLRGSFVIANGVTIRPAQGFTAKQAKAELEWSRDFFEYNKLDRELSQELAKEAEIEGKIALKITPDKQLEELPAEHSLLPIVKLHATVSGHLDDPARKPLQDADGPVGGDEHVVGLTDFTRAVALTAHGSLEFTVG